MAKRSWSRLLVAVGLVAAPALAAAAPAQGAGYEPSVHAAAVAALAGEYRLDARTAAARLAAAPGQAVLGQRLADRFGAGFWVDHHTGRLVVNVLHEADAEAVRAAGARPQLVTRDAATLRSMVRGLDKIGGPAGTAWGIDDAANQLVVMISDGAPRAGLDSLLAGVAALGPAARVERVPGMFTTDLLGGEAIFKSGSRCSAGFNVIPGYPPQPPPSGGNRVLTAGHCGVGLPTWRVGSSSGPLLGATIGASFPGNDYAIIRNDGTVPLPRGVNLYNGSTQTITSGGDPYLNRPVCKSGSTTHVTCGRITATNVTANYAQGPVYELARSNACSNAGDSGGPWFEGPTAVGLHSGSNRVCPNSTTFLQPVGEAMRAYNVFFPNA